MYDELFRQVPDHPRRVRRDDAAQVRRSNEQKLALIDRFLDPSRTILEFGPGDCAFAVEVASRVKFVYGVDISDQRSGEARNVENFRLVVYDGYNLDIDEGSVDVVLSDQLIEHLHPEDTKAHFELVRRLLVTGGMYVVRTPHRFNGPHDVSKYFSDEAECFHLKEWTYAELAELLRGAGYSTWRGYWHARGRMLRMPQAYFKSIEGILGMLPRSLRTSASRLFLPHLVVVAVK
jgi:hypothetical protein